MRYALTLIMVLSVSGALAQPVPPPAAAPPAAVPPVAAPTPGQNSLEQAMRRFSQLNEQMTRTLSEIEANRGQAAQSEQFVDTLLERMNEAVERAAPDGDVANAFRQAARELLNDANEARSRGSNELARLADERAARLQSRLGELNAMYRDARDRARIVASARTDLAAMRRIQLNDELLAAFDRVMNQYRAVVDEVRKMQESLSRGPAS